MHYYQVKVALKTETDSGRIKTVKELYLINAVSVTDAEAKMNEDFQDTGLDFEVIEVKQTSIVKVID